MLLLRGVGRRCRQVEERDALEDQSLPPRGRDGVPLDRVDAEAVEDGGIDRPGVGARIRDELESFEKGKGVAGPLDDQHELLGRIGDADLGERARQLVVASDVERELGPAVP
jgi:hypothetical protein